MTVECGQRTAVVGTSGSGKTITASQIAHRLGIPHVELDALHWEPDWTPAPLDVFRERVARALSGDAWVVDGNYGKVRDVVWGRADTVVWLDYRLTVIMGQLVRRTWRRAVTREALWSGNRESLRQTLFSRESILLWALQTYRRRRREYPVLFDRPEYAHLMVVRLRSPRETRAWLSGLTMPGDTNEEGKTMSEITVQSVYFDQPGPQNTARTLEIAKQRAEELGIRAVLVASTRGETGVQAAQLFQGYNLVVVTHSAGFAGPNTQELTEENRAAIEAAGARILTCQHAFGGISRAVRKKWGTYEIDEFVAQTLRIFGEGIKVVVEIALMAADAGLVRVGEPCLAIAGTGRGADTAVVLAPAHVQQFFDLHVMEVLAKPRLG